MLTIPTQSTSIQSRESEDKEHLTNRAQQELGIPSASEINTLHLSLTKKLYV